MTIFHLLLAPLFAQLMLLPSFCGGSSSTSDFDAHIEEGNFNWNGNFNWSSTERSSVRCITTNSTIAGVAVEFTYRYTMQGPTLLGSWVDIVRLTFGDGAWTSFSSVSETYDPNNTAASLGIPHITEFTFFYGGLLPGTYQMSYKLRRGGFFNNTPLEKTLTLTIESVLQNPIIIGEGLCEIGQVKDNDDDEDPPNNDDSEATSVKKATKTVWVLFVAGLYFLF